MFTFTPTHEITMVFDDGTTADVEVQLVLGAAFTADEWIHGRSAAWRCVEGRWTCLGVALPPHCLSVVITSSARAALRRLEWELCTHEEARDDDAVVIVRDAAGRRALWLEVRDERLRLSDTHHSHVLPSSSSSRHVRALAAEWRACGERWGAADPPTAESTEVPVEPPRFAVLRSS
jgi:hypothetical protein